MSDARKDTTKVDLNEVSRLARISTTPMVSEGDFELIRNDPGVLDRETVRDLSVLDVVQENEGFFDTDEPFEDEIIPGERDDDFLRTEVDVPSDLKFAGSV